MTIAVTGNDSDPDGDLDPTTISVIQQPAHGVVSCSNGSCTYGPVPGFNGIDSFVYEICDSDGACDTAAVIVIVTSSVPPPGTGGDGSGGGGAGASTGGDSGAGGGADGGSATGTGGGPGGGGQGSDDDVAGRTDAALASDPQGGPGSGAGSGSSGGSGQPALPGSDPSGGGPADGSPTFGAPRFPLLPFTGVERIAFFIAVAIHLVVLGGLVLYASSMRARLNGGYSQVPPKPAQWDSETSSASNGTTALRSSASGAS